MTSETSDILFARRGAAGIVTLNRPKALNAVTHAMVRALARQLDAWADDAAVTRVIVTAAGERAFSAGGDIRALYDLGRAGKQEEALTFFREEYTLNTAIKRYRKPYVALIDGIVMGGGFGVSVHGSHRVAGDRFAFAMPEVGIGFFPDVGGTWVLPRMPGETGTWVALTGDRLKTADAVAAGIATHHVRSDRFGDLADALCGNVSVDATLAAFAQHARKQREIGRDRIDALRDGFVERQMLVGQAFASASDIVWLLDHAPAEFAQVIEHAPVLKVRAAERAAEVEHRHPCVPRQGYPCQCCLLVVPSRRRCPT